MFTGIIEEVGVISSSAAQGEGRELTIECSFAGAIRIDQSINVNGVCHTVVSRDQNTFTIQSVEETLRKTAIGDLEEGDRVNLERSMTADRLLDGHIVQGHVDATGTILEIEQEDNDRLFTIEYPEKHRSLIVPRGSISVDGISLTVAREKSNRFTVAIIPYTFDHTNLKDKKPGDRLNLEYDILGKYVVRYLQNRQ